MLLSRGVGRIGFSLFVLGLFAACGGESVYTEGGTGGDGGSGGATGGKGGTNGKGGRGGKGGSDGTGGDTGGSGGATGATGGGGGRTGGTGGGGDAGGGSGGTGGAGGSVGGAGGRNGGAGGAGGSVGGGPAGTGGIIICPSGYVNCGGGCVNPSTDRRHCGACENACLPGELCELGDCRVVCPAGSTECFGLCVDTDTDRRFCGSCDTSCGVGQVCEDGECVLTCPAPLVECDGVCTRLDDDLNNCGACGNICLPLPNTIPTCGAGGCNWECEAETADCNGAAIDGCEANLMNDEDNCGGCGVECNGSLGCVDGTCPTGTYHWELVTTHACNAWCSKAPAPMNTCAGPWECGPATLGGLIWIYAGGPTPPPNPASSATSGYGWVHWYCDRNGCDGPGEPSGTCDDKFDNSIYRCVFD